MDINFMVIIGGAVLSMIVGSIWYGPLFGKKWMEICGITGMDATTMKQKQKEAMPLYAIQFVLSLLQLFVLVNLITYGGWTAQSVWVCSFIWLGFIMPTVAGGAMWNGNSNGIKWATFLIQSGYQLVMFLIYGFMISMWV